ncbi:MAG: sugar-binding protein [Chitinophagales bacterium]
MIKRCGWFAVLLLLVSLVVGVVGVAAKDKLVIAVVPKALDNPVFVATKVGAEAAAKELGVELMWVGPVQADAARQVEVIEGLIQKKVDGIALSANDPDALVDVINEAVAAGIKVSTWDSDVPKSKRAFYYGTNNYRGGFEAGKLLSKLLNGKGEVALLTGVPGAFNLEERIRGFRDAVKGTQITVKNVLPCNDDINTGVQVIESYNRANPGLDGWFMVGGWPLFAPEEALGFLKSFKGKIVAFDTLPSELKFVTSGTVHGLVGQKFDAMGRDSVRFLVEMIRDGKKFPSIMDSGLDIVTAENVEAFMKAAGSK